MKAKKFGLQVGIEENLGSEYQGQKLQAMGHFDKVIHKKGSLSYL